jgi:hypothetical protein
MTLTKMNRTRAPLAFASPLHPPLTRRHTLRLLKRKREFLPLHTFLFLSPIRFRSPPSPLVDGGVYIFELGAALASMGAGWALSRACLLPLGLSSLSRSPVAGPGPEHRRVLRRRRHMGGPQILLPPSSFFGSGPVRSHSSHAFAGAWDLWSIFFPFPIAPEGGLRKRSVRAPMWGQHVALLLRVHAVAYGVHESVWEAMLAWQGGRGARFVVGCVIDGRRGRYGNEVLLLDGQGAREEGRCPVIILCL